MPASSVLKCLCELYFTTKIHCKCGVPHWSAHWQYHFGAYSLWWNSFGRWKCWLYRDLRLDFNLLIIWNPFQCTAYPYRNCVKHKHKHNFGSAGNNNIAVSSWTLQNWFKSHSESLVQWNCLQSFWATCVTFVQCMHIRTCVHSSVYTYHVCERVLGECVIVCLGATNGRPKQMLLFGFAYCVGELQCSSFKCGHP